MKLPFLTTARVFMSAYDPDAQAFITAAGITNTTQKNAINQLVLDLKSYSLWTKMVAIYPFVGGTASSHSYNLKNTAQYQITWSGTVTHDSNGITGNGSTGYGNLNITGTNLNFASNHFGFYSRTNLTAEQSDMGNLDSGFNGNLISSKWSDNNTYWGNFDSALTGAANIISNTTGLIINNRTSSTSRQMQRNGTAVSTVTSTASSGYAYKFIICARWNATGSLAQYLSTRNYAFCCLGDGLNGTESANLYTVVQNYQTRLGRQV